MHGRVTGGADPGEQPVAITNPHNQRLADQDQQEEAESVSLTLADIYADISKSPAPDSEGGVFHASTEDFIAALRARRRETAQ